jgi:hypothetical protein
MRHISQLDQSKKIPNDTQYNIRGRADALLEKWQKLIAASELSGANVNGSKAEKAEKLPVKADESKEPEAKPAANGSVTAEKAENATTDAEEAPPAYQEDIPMDMADD